MNRIGTNGYCETNAKGWRYIYNDDDSKFFNRGLKSALQFVSLNTIYVCSTVL
jgi:hypothetical protein